MGSHPNYLSQKKLLDLPFGQVFQVEELTEHGMCWLIQYNPSLCIPSLLEEMELWFELKPRAFPEIIEHTQRGETAVVITKALSGTSMRRLLAMTNEGMEEEQALNLAPKLTILFESLFRTQIGPIDPRFLLERMYFTIDGDLKVLPSLLYLAVEHNRALSIPFVRNEEEVPLADYVRALGRSIFYLLTKTSPPGDISRLVSRYPIEGELKPFLDILLAASADNFWELRELANALQAVPDRAHPIPSSVGETPPAPKEKPKPARESLPKKTRKFVRLSEKSRISLVALLAFTRELSAMMQSGIPLATSLDTLSQHEQDPLLEELFISLRIKLEMGEPFAPSLSHFKKIFPPYYVAMVAAGEASGMLDESLERITQFLERELSLVRKVKAALSYPILLLVVSLVVAAAIVDYSFPPFFSLLKDFKIKIPLITRIVMSGVLFIQSPVDLLLVAGYATILLAGFYFVVKIYLPPDEVQKWKEKFDGMKLKFPILGGVVKKINCTRFCRSLASLYANGIPIKSCLTLSQGILENKVFQKEVESTLEGLISGKTISESLKERNIFPPPVIHMVAVGEETGELAMVLRKVSDYYDIDLEHALETLSSALEPIIVVILGVVLGTLIISLFVPLYQIVIQLKS